MTKFRTHDWKNPFENTRGLHGKSPAQIYQAGADALLEALFELAKKSPTGKFTIDSEIVIIYNHEDSK